jgi:hypothetical protein
VSRVGSAAGSRRGSRYQSRPIRAACATTADHLMLVFEGAYASTQALGAAGPAGQARNVAQALIDTATPISP